MQKYMKAHRKLAHIFEKAQKINLWVYGDPPSACGRALYLYICLIFFTCVYDCFHVFCIVFVCIFDIKLIG